MKAELNIDVSALRAKLDKLCALIDHPGTPLHESVAAMDRWMEINRKVLKVERARRGCLHANCIELDDCRVCTQCEAVMS